jgi:beta-galactosidase GanA
VKYLGCAYYPEYWGVQRVKTDAKLMRKAGINIVRIGEFAWCRMEPEDGRFTLDWLHETVETLAKSGIDVLMCTPTAAPPAWLTSAYPDALVVRADGTRATHGGRRHYCTTSDTYRRLSARITDVLSEEMAQHRNVVACNSTTSSGLSAATATARIARPGSRSGCGRSTVRSTN